MRSRWVSLLLITRLPAACVSVGLLLVHEVSDQDAALVVATVSWTAITLLAATHVPVVERSRLAWALDIGVALALTWASGDWRSPFYVFGAHRADPARHEPAVPHARWAGVLRTRWGTWRSGSSPRSGRGRCRTRSGWRPPPPTCSCR